MNNSKDVLLIFRDGICPECERHTYGDPLHCNECGWTDKPMSQEQVQVLREMAAMVENGAVKDEKDHCK